MRHRLPVQPQGFESVGPVQISTQARDLSAAKLEKERWALVHVYSAARAASGLVHECQHLVAEISHLLDVEAVVAHLFLKSPDVRKDLVAAPEHARLRERRVLLELRSEERRVGKECRSR